MAKTPKRYADTPAWQIPVDDNQLTTLGRVMVVWGQIDFQTINVLAGMFEIDLSVAIALLDNVTSGTLNNYLRRNLELIGDPEIRTQAKGFCARMSPLIDRRNHLTHGIWGWELNDAKTMVQPACHYPRAERSMYAAELEDLLKQVMAESHVIHGIFNYYVGYIHPRLDEPPPFIFGPLADDPDRDWYATHPLLPGKPHQKSGQT